MAWRHLAEANSDYPAMPTVNFAKEDLTGMATFKGLNEIAQPAGGRPEAA